MRGQCELSARPRLHDGAQRTAILLSERVSVDCCKNNVILSVTVCRQSLDLGSACTNTTQPRDQFYFDLATGECKKFIYRGCSGNDNRFANEDQCINFCAASLPSFIRDSLTLLAGVCRYGAVERLDNRRPKSCNANGDCQSQYECQSPQYGPPGRQYCCPTARKWVT